MDAYLGIDIGTSESKGLLIDRNGQIIISATTSHAVDNPKPGYYSQDAEAVWWGDFCLLSRKLSDYACEHDIKICCVAFSALGCDLVPVDKDGNALLDAILYGIDSRAGNEIKSLKEIYKDSCTDIFGHEPCSSDIAPKILWLKNNHPDIWDNAAYFLTASSYLCAKLTGNFVLDPYLAEDFLPLYDIKNGCINVEGCRDFCRPNQLASLLPATAIAGTITKVASLATGLSENILVLTGTGDSGAEAISSGVCLPGDMMIQLGSTGYIIYLSDKMLCEPRLWPGTFILHDTYGICAGTNTAGALTKWMKDELYRDDASFSKMADEAGLIPPGSDGLICLPYFAGERTPINNPHARGIFFGFNMSHSRAHMVRAGLEGICYTLLANVNVIKEHKLPIKRIIAVGGGTKNPVWLQCLADILEQEIFVPSISIGAAYGDALMAALSAGAFKDWAELSSKIEIAKTYVPRPEFFEIYRKQFKDFKNLYEATRSFM